MHTRANPASTLFPLLLAGLLAGLSYWLELTSRAPTARDNGKARHDPDYIVEQFEVRRFDQQGNLQHTVVADQMQHYPDDDSTVVLTPRLTYHRDPPTFVVAREAHISSKGEHVELIDDVRVTRAGQTNKPSTVLTTSRLDAWPDDELAKTNVPVTITQGQTNVRGSGLSVDNKTSIYILEGPVEGVFFRTSHVQPASAPQSNQVLPPAPDTAKPVVQTGSVSAPKAKSISSSQSKSKSKPKPKSKSKSKPKTSR